MRIPLTLIITIIVSSSSSRSTLITSYITFILNIGIIVKEKIKILEAEFKKMVAQLQAQLARKGISVDKLLDTLTLLPVEVKMEYETVIQKMLPELQKVETIQQVFHQLGPLLHFLDFHLLKYLIQSFGSDDLKSSMMSYEEGIDDFMRSTTIADVIDYWPGKRLPSTDFKLLWMKIGDDILHTHTLHKLNELRRKHSCHLQLSVILSGIVDIVPTD